MDDEDDQIHYWKGMGDGRAMSACLELDSADRCWAAQIAFEEKKGTF